MIDRIRMAADAALMLTIRKNTDPYFFTISTSLRIGEARYQTHITPKDDSLDGKYDEFCAHLRKTMIENGLESKSFARGGVSSPLSVVVLFRDLKV